MATQILNIRPALEADEEAIWRILEPIFRAGETYAVPRNLSREETLAYWNGPGHEVFVAERNHEILGTYFMQTNHMGGGSHVANCGYITAAHATGQGIARSMCEHSLIGARARGYRAMQFNFVVCTNERAVRLWLSFGFEIVGRLPEAFMHPRLGYVDALVMFRNL